MPTKISNGVVVELIGDELAEFEARLANPPVPDAVDTWRARAIMELTPHGEGNLLQAVEALVEAIPDPATRIIARHQLTSAPHFLRGAAIVLALASELGLSEPQIDALFRAAEALPA